MTTAIADLGATTEPLHRAKLLADLADAEEAAGRHARARLVRIVADGELLLSHPDYEPSDPTWDTVEALHPLAYVTDRATRAEHLEHIHASWAAPQFGAEAASILLTLAEAERDAADTALPSAEPGGQPSEAPTPAGQDWAATGRGLLTVGGRGLLDAVLSRQMVLPAGFILLLALVLLGPSWLVRFAAATAIVVGIIALIVVKFVREG
ncbi:hypothetical protein [Acrocarpospora catenulata]|uniref:hypothetical protein n=1 Tax=Acrocarpospora catenulata TaxID=2836182 RepID=UPI002023AB50|nr:hypothetical protein [Acrocarpospora catenulata]